MKKKLQIFISSTYTDLQEERQAAVEAVLASNNIPAGMELFKAGNVSQWDTIKRWIDESDIYMLILGGRYGSIEEKSGKSYTHLEYDYASSINKPIFSVVLSEAFLSEKESKAQNSILEHDNKSSYDAFKDIVTKKIVKFVDDTKDIKLSIHESLAELKEDYEFDGWIRGKDVEENDIIKKELDLLKEENRELLRKIDAFENQRSVKDNIEDNEFLSNQQIINIEGYTEWMGDKYAEQIKVTNNEIIGLLGPGIITDKTTENAKEYFENVLKEKYKKSAYSLHVEKSWFDRMKVILSSKEIISIKQKAGIEYLILTANGRLNLL